MYIPKMGFVDGRIRVSGKEKKKMEWVNDIMEGEERETIKMR